MCIQHFYCVKAICIFVCLCSSEFVSLYTILAPLFIQKVAQTWACLSCSLQLFSATDLALHLCLGAEQRLALTCVREVVELMEFYTWQPSRQSRYVFKILSRNKTCFCCFLGQVGLFLSLMALRGPRGEYRKLVTFQKEGIPSMYQSTLPSMH